jgi:hypothetical protein
MGHLHRARRSVRWSRTTAILALVSGAAGVQAEGLVLRAPDSSITGHSPSEYALAHAQTGFNSIRVFGDYYFFDPTRSDMGPTLNGLMAGFRASTGIAGLGQPLSLFDVRPETTQNLPYVGLGYSRLWFKSQLSFNADFGLASQNAAGAGHARGLFGGSQSLDDIAGELRWAPVMAINVRYSF